MEIREKETAALFKWKISGIIAIMLLLVAIDVREASARQEPARPARKASQTESRTITGIVEDENGAPVIGANVTVIGAPVESGTSTDIEGKFTIMAHTDAVLEISFIGYRTLELPIHNQTEVVAVLEEESERLDNVVVVGYGTQKKSDLTGSIVSVKGDDIEDVPARSIAEALQGKVAGVTVSKTDGRPGSTSDIVIRGVGSINGLSPLFVIDGVARSNNSNYNLKDIESIEVIKDASAAAIYGSRAAGGVVLITTKKGNYDSKARFEFTSHVGMREMVDRYDLLNTTDYIRVRQALGENYDIWKDPSSLPNTDWVSELFRMGIEQSYNLSVTGGSKKLRYYLSGGYERENGIQIDNYWERISARLNVDYKVCNSVTIGTRMYLARIKSSPYTVSYPWRSLPYMSVYNEDGSYASVPPGIEFSGANPVAEIYKNHQTQSDLLTEADLYVDWNIVKGLTLNVTGSAQLGGGYYDYYAEPNDLGRSPHARQLQQVAQLRRVVHADGNADIRPSIRREARLQGHDRLRGKAGDTGRPERYGYRLPGRQSHVVQPLDQRQQACIGSPERGSLHVAVRTHKLFV